MGNINLNSELFADLYNNNFTRHFGDYNLEFTVYAKEEAEQFEVSGVYIFLNSNNLQKDIYIGKAENLRNRLLGHNRWTEAQKLGADCVAIARVKEDILEDVEKILIQIFNPTLNKQNIISDSKDNELFTDFLRLAMKLNLIRD